MKITCFSLLAVVGLLVPTTYGDEPKRYSVTLASANIGTDQFNDGEYKLLVHRDEPKVSLMEIRTGKVIDVVAKAETGDKKFDRTEVYSQEVNGVKQINEIRIAGTRLRIDFRRDPSI